MECAIKVVMINSSEKQELGVDNRGVMIIAMPFLFSGHNSITRVLLASKNGYLLYVTISKS